MDLQNLKVQILTFILSYITKSKQQEDYVRIERIIERIDDENDWIIDSGIPAHATGHGQKLQNLSKCKVKFGKKKPFEWLVTRFVSPVQYSGNTVVNGMRVGKVYHVPLIRNNFLSVHKLCRSCGYFCVFGHEGVKFYYSHLKEKIVVKPVIEARFLESRYVISSETAYEINNKKDWIVDTRSIRHKTGDGQMLHNLSKYKGNRKVRVGTGRVRQITHMGDAVIFTLNNAKEVPLYNVLHIPGLDGNFLSVSQLTDEGYFVLFDENSVKIFEHFEIVEKPSKQGSGIENLYVMPWKRIRI